MPFLSFTSLTQRFAVWFIGVSLLPIAIIGYSLLHTFEIETQQAAIQHVSAIADMKAEQIDSYLRERLLDAKVIQAAGITRTAMRELAAAYAGGGKDSAAYRELDARYREYFRHFIDEADYYDLLLIAPGGEIVYSDAHEADFATSLVTGRYRDSGLGAVVREAMETRQGGISDFRRYAPSHDRIAAFAAFPILVEGRLEGVLALQIYSEHVFQVVLNDAGLGASGETVLTRPLDGGTALVMAPLKHAPDAALTLQIPFVHGDGGGLKRDYRGREVVAAWRHLSRTDWGIEVKMDADEVFAFLQRVQAFSLLVLALVGMAAILGALLFSRRVVTTLKNLSLSARRIAAGNLEQRVPVAGWDEIGQLADTFNTMTEHLSASNRRREDAESSLRQLNQELERRVIERTADLERANATLASREEETRSIVEHMMDCIVTIDDASVIRSVNPVIEKLFGYTRDEVVGQSLSVLMPEPHRSGHGGYVERYLRSGQGRCEFDHILTLEMEGLHNIGTGREVVGRHKSGEPIELYVAVSEYFVSGKRYFTGILRDIRERKRAEQALRDSEQRLRAIVDNLAALVGETTPEGVLVDINRSALDLGGVSRETVIGHRLDETWWFSHSADTQEQVRRDLERARAGESVQRDIEVRVADGSLMTIDFMLVPIRDAGGRVVKLIPSGVDISERIRIMHDLEQARFDAEQANQAKSIFLAAMSHEIRTPMNGVIGMADVLQQTHLSDYQMEMVDLIRESAFALLEIIDDILDFSKIEAGRLELEEAPMSVASVVEKACSMLESLAARKEVELTLFLDPAIPEEVLGDALRLRQVLVNLANNAIKFSSGRSERGQVSVRALLAGRSEEQVAVEFQVCDNGIGMDEETQSRLFTAFTQGDASTTRRFGGTGLGLAISHHLVRLMGGGIDVRSAPGEGAVFTVHLSFTPLPARSSGSDEADLRGLCCLVLGDARSMGDDLAVYLEHGGATVERALDLAAACRRIAGLPPGLWLFVIDAVHDAPPVEALRAACRARPGIEPRFIVVRRGRRRHERFEAAGMITLDGDVMHRSIFLRAVALAGGRTQKMTGAQPSGRMAAVALPSQAAAMRAGTLILVAEDNEINRRVIRQQLALLGYAADIVDNGREALARWQEGRYALLLTDLHMPEMDGYQLTASIRAAEQGGTRIPIIAFTANALKGEAERCRAAGMDDYLSKPVQLVHLKTILQRWLPLRGSEVPAAAPALAAAPPVLDADVLKALVGDDPAVIAGLLRDFRASARDLAADLRNALLAEEAAPAAVAAHTLKSSARAVGALPLGELCAEMEALGRAGDLDAMRALLPRLESALAAVDAHIEAS